MRRSVVMLSIVLLLGVLAACDAVLIEEDLEPTWEFTGPTLAATAPAILSRPTDISEAVFSMPGQNDPTAAALPANSSLPPTVLDRFSPACVSCRSC